MVIPALSAALGERPFSLCSPCVGINQRLPIGDRSKTRGDANTRSFSAPAGDMGSLLEQAQAAVKSREYERALDLYTQVWQAKPTCSRVWYTRRSSLCRQS